MCLNVYIAGAGAPVPFGASIPANCLHSILLHPQPGQKASIGQKHITTEAHKTECQMQVGIRESAEEAWEENYEGRAHEHIGTNSPE